jgi:pyruvate carboxylase subunit B
MLFTTTPKKIRVMFTPFRDGLQSSFGGKVRLADILPAMEFSAKEAGVRHFEFGGGARYQAPYFYVGEDPFACMDSMRQAVGPDVDLQILTRSVSGVTLTTQKLKALELQARLMAKHGTTWDRNFDYMNDVDNLERTGKPIVDAGMHHQVCVALMGLPFADTTVHTPEFYIGIIRKLLDRGVQFDSVCMKDASGTTDPKTCYETAKGLRKILPPEVILWQHTHDTASMAVSCYLAGIEGGVDGIDLSVRPMASGTVQPDVRSMWHALKGTGFSLDIDHSKMNEIENMLDEGLAEYDFNPVTTTADARVVGFPMPGGAIGPNVHMMKEAGILDRYSEVLAEFPVVVKAGGAWTSVTPGSQQYWLQAFNNVLLGRWEKMNDGYGKAVLGYFGRPPLPPDPEVVRRAAEQLGKEPFDGDPLEAAPDSLAEAEQALKERGLPITEENTFLVASAIVPGKNMDLNEGVRLLTGKPKIVLPLKQQPESAHAAPQQQPAGQPPSPLTSAITTRCTVREGSSVRTFRITIEPPEAATAASPPTQPGGTPSINGGTPVFSPFQGKTELVEIKVNVGDSVDKGQVVAAVEAMKAKHDVKAPCAGKVISIDAEIGADIAAGQPILTIGG